MNSTGYLFVVVSVAFAAAAVCAIVAVLVGKPPRSRQYVARAGFLGVLAGLAPISAVIFVRLSTKSCVVLNILGLPWAEPWREITHWGAGAVWVASTILLVVALRGRELRRAGIVMLVWSVIIALPTLLLYFLIVFGDPAGNCVPVQLYRGMHPNWFTRSLGFLALPVTVLFVVHPEIFMLRVGFQQ